MNRTFAIALIGTLVATTAAQAEDLPVKKPKPLAVNARIVGTEKAEQAWLVIDPSKGDGEITDVTTDESKIPSDALRIVYDGYAFPGLIDTHNHVHYNAIPQWKHPVHFVNRYEWSGGSDDYQKRVEKVYSEKLKNKYDGVLYGEIRAIVGGTTMIQSSYYGAPPAVLARNLTADYKIATTSRRISEIETDLKAWSTRLQDPSSQGLKRVFLHVAEGVSRDPVSESEFEVLDRNGLVRPGVVVIHGTALTKEQYRTMAANKMYLSWSPRSNINLYDQTTDIPTVLESGVTVALSPDWTVSGSNNLLEEMKFAYEYSKKKWGSANPVTPQLLFKMVTQNAAQVSGLEEHFGELKRGYAGDFFLAPVKDKDPFVSLLKTGPKDLNLVVVAGKPVYGDDARMSSLEENSDAIVVDGANKRIVIVDQVSSKRLTQVETELRGNLQSIGSELAPIIESQP